MLRTALRNHAGDQVTPAAHVGLSPVQSHCQPVGCPLTTHRGHSQGPRSTPQRPTGALRIRAAASRSGKASETGQTPEGREKGPQKTSVPDAVSLPTSLRFEDVT
jgi:hypothetical protein